MNISTRLAYKRAHIDMKIAENITDQKNQEASEAASSGAANAGQLRKSFSTLPESVGQMRALPEVSMDTPFKTAALTVCALCAFAAAPENSHTPTVTKFKKRLAIKKLI